MTDTSKYYWFPETDTALIEYRNEPDQHKRDVIYKNHLNEPFLRLAESIVNIIRPRLAFIKEDTDELKYIVIAHLLEFIPKYDPSRGTGFTFFSLVGKHFLMNSNMRAEKVFKLRAETLVPLEEDEELCSSHAYSYEDDIPYDDGLGGRIHPMLQYYKNNISIWNEKYGNEMYEYILDNIDLEMAEPLPYQFIKKEVVDALYEKCGHKYDRQSLYDCVSKIGREYVFIQTSQEPRYVEHRKNIDRIKEDLQ